MNRVWWDLRSEPSTEIRLRTSPLYAPEVTVGPEGWRPAPGNERISLLEPPGTYTVKLSAAGQEFTQKLKVLKDPHSTGTESDIQAQMKLMLELREEMNALAGGVNQLESLRAQLATLERELGSGEMTNDVRKAAQDLNNKLTAAEEKLMQLKATGRGQDDVRWPTMLVGKISYLAGEVSSSDFPPTTQDIAVHEELKKQAASSQEEIRQLVAKDVAAFNAMLRERGIGNIISRTQP